MKNFNYNPDDQLRVLADVAQNRRSKAAPIVRANMLFLVDAYQEYVGNRGNPWLMTGYVKNSSFQGAMKRLYLSKLPEVSYITDLRRRSRGRCCAFCGSLNSNQIDHFLPQEHYPEFSIFLLNLFPICACNQSKGKKTIGANDGQRFLHPQFDRKIGERSIFVRIRCHGDAPTYSVLVRKPKAVRDAAAFHFHTQKLVSQEALVEYVKDGFERFCRRPGNIVRSLKDANPRSKEHLVRLLFDEIREACWQHQSKNNWESVMLQSLVERRTVKWLWKRFSAPGRNVGDPLVRL